MEVTVGDDGVKDDYHYEQRMVKAILSMPPEVQNRFKILKVLNDRKNKTVDQIRKLNLKYEQLKEPLYELRRQIIAGEDFLPEYLNRFDQKYEKLKKQIPKDADEEEFAAEKVDIDEVVEHKGVPGFWKRVLKSHNLIRDYVKKQDEPILMHLANITGQHFPDKFGYELTFYFSPNEFMENVELRKTYHMLDDRILERTESTQIIWKEGKDPTKKKIKKKQQNKKTGAVRQIWKTVDQDSFFQFFKSHTMPEHSELEGMDKEKQEELAVKLDEDFDLGNDILNEIIPEALEYYLGVVDDEISDLDSDTEEEDADQDGEGDDQDDGEGDNNSPEPKEKDNVE